MNWFRPLLLCVFAILSTLRLGSAADNEPQATPNGEGRRPGPAYALVCLQNSREPALSTLRKSLASWLKVPLEEVSEGERIAEQGKLITRYKENDRTINAILAYFPVPKADIENACENSFLWPEAHKAVSGSKAHVIVVVQGKFENPGAEGIYLSRAVAACTETFNASAVYWSQALLLSDPAFFRQTIRDAENKVDKLPVQLWVSFLRGDNTKEKVDIYTKGLAAFGAMECEVVGSRQRPSEIVDVLTGVAAYLIANGNVVADGDTVGTSEKQGLKAHHTDSAMGRKEKVLRIDF